MLVRPFSHSLSRSESVNPCSKNQRALRARAESRRQGSKSNHGVTIDGKGNVWIGGNGAEDNHVLKFTQDGKFIKQFGFPYANSGSNDTWAFHQVAKIFVDDANNEAYIADGYGNKRVAVID